MRVCLINLSKYLANFNKIWFFLFFVLFCTHYLHAVTFTWVTSGGGLYSSPSNWSPSGEPENPGDTAIFGSAISTPSTITLPTGGIPSATTFGLAAWNFGNINAYSISGTGTTVFLSEINIAGGGQGRHELVGGIAVSPASSTNTLVITNLGTNTFAINGRMLTNADGQIVRIAAGIVEYGLLSTNTNISSHQIEAGATLNLLGSQGVGNVTIASTGLLRHLNSNVIQPTATVNLIGGWDLNFSPVPETVSIETLNFTGGNIAANSGDTLNLNTLVMRGGLEIPQDLGFVTVGGFPLGMVRFDSTDGGTALLNNVDLGSTSRTWNIENGPAFSDMSIQGVITGSGFTKIGAGTLLIGGNIANTFTDLVSVQEGILRLAKGGFGANSVAIPGNAILLGGTIFHFDSNQYSSTSVVTMQAGTFDMGGSTQAMATLIFNGGTYVPGVLNLVGTGNALTMRGGNTLSGTVNLTSTTGGTVIFDSTIGMTADISAALSLGSIARIFNIADGSAAVDMLLSGFASGTGGITKTGLGTLSFSGATANTYTGLTTISEGTMLLAKGGGVTSIPGDVLINGGTLTNGATEQIADTSSLTLSSGSWVLSGNDEAIESFTFNGGSYLAGGATLSLTSTGTALTMRDVTLTGQVDLIGASGGDVVFDATNGGTATIDSIDLGLVNRTFNIANGSTDTDMVVNSSSSTGGGLIKQGAGLLELAGTHTYLGGAVSTIAEGPVRVTGTWATPTLNVSNPGILKGTGTIIGNVSLDGTIQPGNSIGTIFLVGVHTFNNGSVTEIEISPTATDLIDITGTLTINSGATLALFPEVATYPDDFSFPIITTTGGVSGEFTAVTTTNPLFAGDVVYTPTEVLLQLILIPFVDIFDAGNPGSISFCIDQEMNSSPDFEFVVSVLRGIPTLEGLTIAIDQIAPSEFNSLALSQENNTIRIRSMVTDRLFELYRCCRCYSNDCSWTAWGSAKADWYDQDCVKEFVGFRTYSGTAMVGVDFQDACNFIYGGGAGYSYSDLKWDQSRGDGNIHSAYFTLYYGWCTSCYFANLIALGTYSRYSEKRNLRFTAVEPFGGTVTIDRRAKGNFNGGEILGHLDLGFACSWGCLDIIPFGSLEYVYLWQADFTERGAGSLDLEFNSLNYDLLRFELGVNFAYCFTTCFGRKVSLDGKLSYVREDRFTGDRFRVSFEDTECVAKIRGLNPARNLFVPSGGVTIMSCDECKTFSLTYEAEVGSRYLDQNIGIQFICRF